MYILAQIVGILAVVTFLSSYQMKTRKGIILVNALGGLLFIVQYVMLGAYIGAFTDVLATVSTLIAHQKEKPFVKKHFVVILTFLNLCMFATGMLMYTNIFSLFPVAGAILQTSALWITKERDIRLVSFLGTPFWVVYNLVSKAYGASIGSVLSMLSIAVAIYRYDIRKKK